MVEVNTIEPFPLAFISGRASRLKCSPASTWRDIIFDNAATDKSDAGIWRLSPALLT
jgi:hypothetical protein